MVNPRKLREIPPGIIAKAACIAFKSASRKSLERTFNNPYVKKGILTATVCVTVLGNTIVVSAATREGVVNVDSRLRIRQGASTQTDILGRLEDNDVVEIIGEEGDFYKIIIPSKISSDFKEGYVHKDYVIVSEQENEEETVDLEEQESDENKIYDENYELVSEVVITAESSSDNRNYNIALACQRLDGLTLQPGEQFDWYGSNGLGEANKENGFKESTIISGGKYVKGYGGGVCQVSTALYNCIYNLDIIPDEIHHHSLPSSYVEKGMDATVAYSSGKNFIFTNQKNYTLKFELYSEGGSVTVKAYKVV